MNFIYYAATFIVAISVLVAVHEYGHYIVARWCGIKVLRYSIGFGKPLFLRRGGKDQTEYCISAIPLGGYVKLLDERDSVVAPEERDRSFNAQPVWQRVAVLLAGPMFNFIFAFFAYWALFVYGVPALKPYVGQIEPDSYADKAGLIYEDRIQKVAGHAVNDWEAALFAILEDMVDDGDIALEVVGADGSTRQLSIDVGDESARLTEPGELFSGLGMARWSPAAVIGSFVDGSGAEAAGMRVGDQITSIDDTPVRYWNDLGPALDKNATGQATVAYLRGEQELQSDVTLQIQTENGQRRALLGIQADDRVISDIRVMKRYSFVDAMPRAVERVWEMSAFTVRMFGRMITGDVSYKNLSGPVSIAQFVGDSAKHGFDYFLQILALISLSLGILNLLPIPILDGGQIVYQLAEGIKGAPLSEQAQIIGQQIGLFLLLVLMSFALFNDFSRLFTGS